MLAATFMFASTLTASSAVVVDGNTESKVEISTLLDRMNIEADLDAFAIDNDQDPKKEKKTTKAKSKDAKSGECQTSKCNSTCSEKETMKKAAKEKKKS